MSYTIKGMDKFVKLSEKIPKEPESWTCEDVSEWLRLIEMEQYVETFRKMSIDGWLIFEIEEDDLISDLQIKAKLHRKKIMKGIKMLKEYKTYIRNNLTKGEPSNNDGPLYEEPSKSSGASENRIIEENKVNFRPGPVRNDQTRPADVQPKIPFTNAFGKCTFLQSICTPACLLGYACVVCCFSTFILFL